MAKFEGSAIDRKIDKAGAKKAGVSMKKWEGSTADKNADAKGLRKMAMKEKMHALPERPGPSKMPSSKVRSTTKNSKY